MGTILKVKNADFSENGMKLIVPPIPEDIDVMPLFQANMLSGKQVNIGPMGDISTANSSTRIAFDKTTLAFTTNSVLKIKMKSGFQMAMGMYKGTTRFAGSASNGGWSCNTSYAWISVTKEFVVSLRQFDAFAANIRYSDNTSTFSDNTLSNYIDYMKLVYVPESTTLDIIKGVLESSYFEHVSYNSATSAYRTAPSSTNNRNSVGAVYGDAIDNTSFVVTPKSGCKIAPVQSSFESDSGQFTFEFVTSPVTFQNISSYPCLGITVAYTDDRDITAGTSLWEFIDVALVQ